MRRPSLSHFKVCAGLIALLAASNARSARAGDAVDDHQRATARTLFNEGLEYSDAGRWQEAADRFGRAYAMKPTPEIAYNLAQAYIRLGHLAGGAELLRRAADDPAATPAVRGAAKARLAQVSRRLGRLTVQVPAPPGAIAYLDGQPLERSRIGVVLPVDPGPHLVQARWPDGAAQARRVTLSEGAETTVALAPVVAATDPPREAKPGLLHRGWFWVAVGGLAAGTAAALMVPHLRGGETRGNVDTWHLER